MTDIIVIIITIWISLAYIIVSNTERNIMSTANILTSNNIVTDCFQVSMSHNMSVLGAYSRGVK